MATAHGEITKSDVRSALEKYLKASLTKSSKDLDHFDFGSINQHSAYIYALESFSERRKVTEEHIPYHRHDPVDGHLSGCPPAVWDILVNRPAAFVPGQTKSKLDFVIPHTDRVETCHCCHGCGYETCHSCHGRGCKYVDKTDSDGRTRTEQERCVFCHGTGRKTCHKCDGKGLLKWFLKMHVTWKNTYQECVINQLQDRLPNKLLKKSVGDQIFVDWKPRLYPVNDFPDENVVQASNGLIQHHLKSLENEMTRIIEQKHEIISIPVAVVEYLFKNKSGDFFVYGCDHQVHFNHFPAKRCVIM